MRHITRELFTFVMSSPQGSVRQRGPKDISKKRPQTPNPDGTSMNGSTAAESFDVVIQKTQQLVNKDWDYKIAFTVITILAFITRFWGISHPDQVVFDEVHFGKVS